MAAATFSDMKSELFGVAEKSDSRRGQRDVERDLSAVLSGEDHEEEIEEEEGEGRGMREGEGDDEEGDSNAYGGMLT